jgi:alkylation response protein AidB-like acyl-CoA dehydrogenase
MDLAYSAAERAFREDVRDFLRAEFPEAPRRRLLDGQGASRDEQVAWQRRLNAHGWAVPHWPVEWGGRDWTAVQRFIWREELETWPALLPLSMNGNLCGPVLIEFGTPEQKRHFLPRMANLDDWWCQGFSEPDAGSDLASLRLSARRQGDHYVLNGSKTWTSHAQNANWMFCLARTDSQARPQEGISFLLLPMDSPGLTVRPIQLMEGGHEVNQCFFDDVRVPVDRLVGTEHRGWDCAKFLLGNERTSSARIGATLERLRRLRVLAATEVRHGRPFIEDPSFRQRLMMVEIDAKAHEITTLRVLDEEMRHPSRGVPNPLSSILKLRASEIRQEIGRLFLEVAGPAAVRLGLEPETQASEFVPPWAGLATAAYLNNRKFSIYGGSSEIQHNVLAKAVLGL